MTIKDGWINIKDALPEPYDLVKVFYGTGRWVPGWWTGCGWDGSREIAEKNIVAWKRYNIGTNSAGCR